MTLCRSLLAALILLFTITGCSSTGLSPRETSENNITALTYSLYDNNQDTVVPPIHFPQAVAVAQMGEVAPPTELIDTLRNSLPFSRVITIPAANGVNSAQGVHQMESIARDLKADSLLVVGGNIDTTETSNSLAIFDLTIVGLFIVPSRNIDARVTASGLLVDLRSGRVSQSFSTVAQKQGVASASSADDAKNNIFNELRSSVSKKLGAEIVDGCTKLMNNH